MKLVKGLVLVASLLTSGAFASEIQCFGASVPPGYVTVGYTTRSECNVGFHVTGKNAREIEKADQYEMTVCSGSQVPTGYHYVKSTSSAYCTMGFTDSIIGNAKVIREN